MHGSKKLSTGIAVAAAAAAIGAPVATAHGSTGCSTASNVNSPSPSWVVVTDDLGIPELVPAVLAPGRQVCPEAAAQGGATTSSTDAAAPSAPASAQTPLASPFAGWVVVYDDQGVPWLYQVAGAGSLRPLPAQAIAPKRTHRTYGATPAY